MEVNERKMAQLKTIVVSVENNLASGASADTIEEIIADEDMKIVGAMFKHHENGGVWQTITVMRGGQFSVLGGYEAWKRVPKTTDQVMFCSSAIYHEDNKYADSMDARWQMLPQGEYFLLEEGERLYFHFFQSNEHASATYMMAGSCVIFYK